jgi:hypothetical protein
MHVRIMRSIQLQTLAIVLFFLVHVTLTLAPVHHNPVLSLTLYATLVLLMAYLLCSAVRALVYRLTQTGE